MNSQEQIKFFTEYLKYAESKDISLWHNRGEINLWVDIDDKRLVNIPIKTDDTLESALTILKGAVEMARKRGGENG